MWGPPGSGLRGEGEITRRRWGGGGGEREGEEAEMRKVAGSLAQETDRPTWSSTVSASPRRGAWVSLASFGVVADGQTVSTSSFVAAVASIEHCHTPGGKLLYVPPGVWLTGPFNLTSHMTLFLARGVEIRATQVSEPKLSQLMLAINLVLLCSTHGGIFLDH
ncbi:hypothetical protein ABZP36_001859 [Zizania latifolia]